jgi:hypothetical protein
MPWSGGFLQQASSFLANVDYFDRVINEYAKIKKRRAKGKG